MPHDMPRNVLSLFFGGHLFGNTEFLILASIVKDVNFVSYMAIFFEAELGVTVESDVEPFVGLPHIDGAVLDPEGIGSLIPVRTMAAPLVQSGDFNDCRLLPFGFSQQ